MSGLYQRWIVCVGTVSSPNSQWLDTALLTFQTDYAIIMDSQYDKHKNYNNKGRVWKICKQLLY